MNNEERAMRQFFTAGDIAALVDSDMSELRVP